MWEKDAWSSCNSRALGRIHKTCSFFAMMMIMMDIWLWWKWWRLWKGCVLCKVVAFKEDVVNWHSSCVEVFSLQYEVQEKCELFDILLAPRTTCSARSIKTQNCANIFNWPAVQCQARLWSFENVDTASSSGCLHWSLQSAAVNCQFTTALLSTAQLHYIYTILLPMQYCC